MIKFALGSKFEGKRSETSWVGKQWSQNGCTELTLHRPIVWVEVENHPYAREGNGYQNQPTEADLLKWAAEDEQDELDRQAAVKKASARRAKTNCRRIIKAEGFDQLLTLTYRDNMVCRDQCKRNFQEFVRRMKKALGGFRYCASLELQQRGAYHVHVACHKLPKYGSYRGLKIDTYKLGTKIWRSVIGSSFLGPMQPGIARPDIQNGMCFIGGKSKFGAPNRFKKQSLSAMADYVSKYIMKDAELSQSEKNRYSASTGISLNKSISIVFHDCCLSDCISLMFEVPENHRVVKHYLAYDCGLWGLSTELK